MRDMRRQSFTTTSVLLLALTIGVPACTGLLGAEEASEPEPTGEPEEERRLHYQGLGLDALGAYAATFEAVFTPDDEAASAWTYTVETLATDSPPGLRLSLSIDGVESEADPGDVTLILLGDTQYMTGQAVGAAGCLTFPASVDLDDSFLSPDDFLAPDTLSGLPVHAGSEEHAGANGTRYTFEAEDLGEFHDVSGELVMADEGGYVLRYDFAAAAVDDIFSDELPGRLTWHYEITELTPGEAIEMPPGCDIDYPLLPDAVDVAKLPDLVLYTSPTSAEDAVAFYEEVLPAEDWERYAFPETAGRTTVLVYARESEFLTISITSEDGGSQVEIFTEIR
jgi:hypothetical protein